MLIDLFIVLLVIAIILTILTVIEENLPFCMIGLMLWILILAQSLYTTDSLGNEYTEYGVSAFALAFIFTHLIILIIMFVKSVNLRKISTTPLSRRIGRAR